MLKGVTAKNNEEESALEDIIAFEAVGNSLLKIFRNKEVLQYELLGKGGKELTDPLEQSFRAVLKTKK